MDKLLNQKGFSLTTLIARPQDCQVPKLSLHVYDNYNTGIPSTNQLTRSSLRDS